MVLEVRDESGTVINDPVLDPLENSDTPTKKKGY
jgi:hypothetical protein